LFATCAARSAPELKVIAITRDFRQQLDFEASGTLPTTADRSSTAASSGERIFGGEANAEHDQFSLQRAFSVVEQARRMEITVELGILIEIR
jgi:hypothetical protein